MRTILLAAALSFFGVIRAADLGDPAADLKIAKWVKGEPVTISENGTYVVEFWATWCPPCRTSIPHLTEMQKRFKDVAFIGVSDEKENVVTPFVKNLGAKMDYRVALDENRKTSAGYMGAYNINGIPHAFIVKERKVIWHGHPMAGLGKALEEITSGRYDVKKEKARFRVDSLYDQFREAAAEGNDDEADRLAKELRAAAAETDSPLKDFDPAKEKQQIRTQMLMRQFQSAVYTGNEKQADEVAAKIKKADPAADLEAVRAEVATHKLANEYLESLTEGKTPKKEIGEQLVGKLKGKAMLANEISWQILTNPRVVQRDLPLTLAMAKQACEDSKWENAGILDTYARALFESGKKEEAISQQQKALAAASEEEKPQLEKTLAAYKEGKLPPVE